MRFLSRVRTPARLSAISSIVLAGCCAAAVAACGSQPLFDASAPAYQAQPIIDGVPSALGDYPSAGVILATGTVFGQQIATMLCTGTLIAPDVVLAAAHCTSDAATMGLIENMAYYFSFELDVSSLGVETSKLPDDAIPVADYVSHPQFDIEAFDTFTGGLATFYDIALLFLRDPITSVTPAVVMRAKDAAAIQVGTDVSIVGYGQRSQSESPWGGGEDAGVKYQAMTIINEVGPSEMQVGNRKPTPQKCHGDSGGPTYMDFDDGFVPARRVIGVTSHAYDDSDCLRGGVDTRVDPYVDWLDATMVAACQDGTRQACDGSGSLAKPTSRQGTGGGGSGSGSGSGRGKKKSSGGCAGATPPSAWSATLVALAAVLMATARRRRARRA